MDQIPSTEEPEQFVGKLLIADSPQSSRQMFEEMLNDLNPNAEFFERSNEDQLYKHFKQVYTGQKSEH
jgi:hypothetical protein